MATVKKDSQRLAEFIELLQSLTEEEKKQAYAMLSGMVIGKDLAEKQKTA